MKTHPAFALLKSVLRPACLGLAFVAAGTAFGKAAEVGAADRTLSPYFLVQSDDPSADRLPLKSTRADVAVAGVIANVKVTQEYRNEGRKTLEAIYVFPGSTRAAVHAMRMTVGERLVLAEIREREKARQEYQQALQSGRTASLLEQQRPNVFQMNVGNIQPGDVIKVEMEYTELLVPEGGVYEFVYPTVVGPRYSNQPAADAPPKEAWTRNPYLHEGAEPATTFDLALDLVGGMPIEEALCPSHQVDIAWTNRNEAHVTLAAADRQRGNKDFILRYRLQGAKVETGLLLFQGAKENYFLLMAQPPKRLAAATIPPRDYIFVVDISGSMHGFPLETSKTLLRDLVGGLRPSDTFNVLLFAGDSSVLSETPLAATPANLQRALALIDGQSGGGGTELIPALRRALALPRGENISRSIVIATDGFVSVETEAFELIRRSLGQANVFAFGIGSSVNRFLIEGMARAGMGEAFVVTNPKQSSTEAQKFRRMVDSPALTRLTVDWGDLQPYEVEPPALPDVMAERPVIVFGKWRGTPGRVTVRGWTGDGRYEETVEAATASTKLEAIRFLWARHRIATLGDFNKLASDDRRVKEITELGLQHHLLTAYTSFVAVDKIKRGNGTYETVKQPLPLPEGVSDLAVGGAPQAPSARIRGAAPSGAPIAAMKAQESLKLAELERAKCEAESRQSTRPLLQFGVGKVTAPASLTESAIRAWFETNRPAIEAGVKQWAPLPSTIELVLKIHVSGSGTVTSVTVENPGHADPAMAEAIVQLLTGRQIQAPADGNDADVILSIVFR